MLKVKSKLVSMLGVFAACAGLSAALAPSAHAGASQVYGSHWAWNNNFNNSNIGITFHSTSDPSFTVWYNFGSYSLYGYPACIRGWHYGWNPAGDTLFPKQVSSISSSNCTFYYSSGGTNMAGDFAYDIFLRNDNQKSTPQLEIMVWAGNNSYPIGSKTASSVVDGRDLWEGMNSAAGYYVYTFIPAGTAGQGSLPTSGNANVNLKSYYNWLAANRSSRFNNSMYVDVVEAGLEITRGNGWAWCQAHINS
jgi:hypothetical protein